MRHFGPFFIFLLFFFLGESRGEKPSKIGAKLVKLHPPWAKNHHRHLDAPRPRFFWVQTTRNTYFFFSLSYTFLGGFAAGLCLFRVGRPRFWGIFLRFSLSCAEKPGTSAQQTHFWPFFPQKGGGVGAPAPLYCGWGAVAAPARQSPPRQPRFGVKAPRLGILGYFGPNPAFFNIPPR